MKLKLTCWLLIGLAYLLNADYPYYYHWKEFSGQKISVLFPDFARSQAEKVYQLAEEILGQLEVYWQQKLKSKIYILLETNRDDSNGSATVYPLNLVTVSLPAPEIYSSIGNFFNWPRSVLVHELSHLFQLNLDNRFNAVLRKIFGRFPLFFPAINLPLWVLEGLAVVAESELSSGGRLNSADFEQILIAAADGNRFLNWKEADGNIIRWPAGAAPYIYGAKFLQFLEHSEGRQKLNHFLQKMTGFAITSSSRSFKQVYQKKIEDYWQEFAAAYRVRTINSELPVHRLTADGKIKRFPRFFDLRTIIYLREDYQSLPTVIRLNLENGSQQKIFSFSAINGLGVEKGKIFFSAFDFDCQHNYFSRAFEWNEKQQRVKLLSRRKRLFSPFAFAERVIAFAQKDGQREIVEISPDGKELGLKAELISEPAVLPDGSRLALTVKEKDSPAEILIFDSGWKQLSRIKISGVNLYNPCWLDQQKLLIIARGQKKNLVLRYDLENKTLEEWNRKDLSPLQLDYSADRRQIVFSFYTATGIDLALLDIDSLRFNLMEMKREEKENTAQQETVLIPANSVPEEKDYRAGRQIFPVFWLPYLNLNSFDPGVGLFTLHQDLIKVLNYQLFLWQGLESRRTNYVFSLSLNIIYPSIQFHMQRDYRSELQSDYFQASLALDFPLFNSRRKRVDLKLMSGLEREEQKNYRYHGFFSGWEFVFRNFRLFPFGFCRSDGVELRIFSRNNSFNLRKNFWGAEFKGYVALFRPNVFAFRLAFAGSNNHRQVIFGGYGQSMLFEDESSSGEQLLNVFRYLNETEVKGRKGWQLNLEYRCGLLKIERVDFFGFYLQRILFVPFFDCGNIKTSSGYDSLRSTCGAELQFLLSSSGYQLKAATGIALPLSHVGRPQFYFRLGSSF